VEFESQTVTPDALKGRRSVVMAYTHRGNQALSTGELPFPVAGDDQRPVMTAADRAGTTGASAI
jgi:hypothetical protein